MSNEGAQPAERDSTPESLVPDVREGIIQILRSDGLWNWRVLDINEAADQILAYVRPLIEAEVEKRLCFDENGKDLRDLCKICKETLEAEHLEKMKAQGWRQLEEDQALPEIPSFAYDSEEDRKLLRRGAINYSKLLSEWRRIKPSFPTH